MDTWKFLMASIVLTMVVQTTAFAHKNVFLQYTMKNASKDALLVRETTKNPAADILDSTVLNAILRTRSAGYFLQTADDRKGKIEEGKLIMDEMTPAPVEEEPSLAKAQEMLTAHSGYLVKSKGKLQLAEKQLLVEFKKGDPTTRDFSAVKNTLDDLDKILINIEP